MFLDNHRGIPFSTSFSPGTTWSHLQQLYVFSSDLRNFLRQWVLPCSAKRIMPRIKISGNEVMILENIMRMMMIYQIYHDLSWSKMGILKLNRWFFWSDPLITTLQTSHSWHRLAILTTSCRCGELAWALNGSLVPQRRFWSLRWAQRSAAGCRHIAT